MGFDTRYTSIVPTPVQSAPKTFEDEKRKPDTKPDIKPKVGNDTKPIVRKGKGKAVPSETVDIASSLDSDIEFVSRGLPPPGELVRPSISPPTPTRLTLLLDSRKTSRWEKGIGG